MLAKKFIPLLNFCPLQSPLKLATMTQQAQEAVMQKIYKTASGGGLSEERKQEFLDTVCVPLATRMLDQIGLCEGATEPFKLLDNGAGLGVVDAEIQKRMDRQVLSRSSIISADFSEPMVGLVKKKIEKEGWLNTEAQVVDAQVSRLDRFFKLRSKS